jgi:hypothetical protein
MKTTATMTLLIIALLTSLVGNSGWAQAKKPVPMPQVQTVGEGVVWRISDTKGESGNFLPPWKEIQITNISGFDKKPVVGEKVTVIPLDVDIPPFELSIVKAEMRQGCSEQSAASWEVDLEPIKQKIFFDMAPGPNRAEEYPFDVSVIYPAVRFANHLKRESLSRNLLPKAITMKTVKAAIDLTNDGKPDVVVVAYCCGDPRKSAEDCDYSCSKTFKKIRNTWKLINTSSPC